MDTDPNRVAFVYLLQAGDAIKIGVAVNIGARAIALQVGNPLPLQLVGQRRFANSGAACRAESALHARFADRRAQGEWFWIPAREAVVALDHFNPVPRPVEGPRQPVEIAPIPRFDYDQWIKLSDQAVFYNEA